ncbi:MAG: hypothetical protein M1376_17690 [Planctomycetes bacterium]|nr:hypothetical protein [Planctomycetota bacterium]
MCDVNSPSVKWAKATVLCASLAICSMPGILWAGATEPEPVLRHSEVVFMYAASEEAYRAYGATFVAWGGAEKAEQVKRHHDLGIRCTGSMWCLTAGAENIHKDPKLRAACAVDIEGKPVEVPWLFDHTYEGTRSYFGCTNNPEFQRLCRERVREAMAGGADGLHVDDHLGTAGAAWWQGGGFCDYCMKGFRAYLKTHATKEQLQQAGVERIDDFDYRTLVRKYATTREAYKKVQRQVPLMDLFLQFHAEAAAEHTRQLGQLAAEVVGHPVWLSANACLPNKTHTYVVKYLTHVICEVGQNAWAGTKDIDHAIEAYELATTLGKPLAATASGQDWAFVKQNNCEDLVRFWIALAYAHGQRFMAPHPQRQWCFNDKLGTHWYAAPVEAYAPLYRFIRANAGCLDGFEAIDVKDHKPTAPANVLVTVRKNSASNQIVLHVLNRDYDAGTKSIKPLPNVDVSLDKSLISAAQPQAKLLSYDRPPQQVDLIQNAGTVRVRIPELKLWTLVVLE